VPKLVQEEGEIGGDLGQRVAGQPGGRNESVSVSRRSERDGKQSEEQGFWPTLAGLEREQRAAKKRKLNVLI